MHQLQSSSTHRPKPVWHYQHEALKGWSTPDYTDSHWQVQTNRVDFYFSMKQATSKWCQSSRPMGTFLFFYGPMNWCRNSGYSWFFLNRVKEKSTCHTFTDMFNFSGICTSQKLGSYLARALSPQWQRDSDIFTYYSCFARTSGKGPSDDAQNNKCSHWCRKQNDSTKNISPQLPKTSNSHHSALSTNINRDKCKKFFWQLQVTFG